MCMYMYIHIYMYIDIYLHIYMYVRICIHVYVYVYVYTHLYVYRYICTYIYVCTHIYICVQLFMYVFLYTCIYIYTVEKKWKSKRSLLSKFELVPSHLGLVSQIFVCTAPRGTVLISFKFKFIVQKSRQLAVFIVGWLRLVGSIKLQVSVAVAEYCLFYRALLQKRSTILSILLTGATPYLLSDSPERTRVFGFFFSPLYGHAWLDIWVMKACLLTCVT